ncbi:MAG: thiol protease/hemagglutinin PrtT [Porphyromonas sp.]|nr:thiol protease/hemagglutinin PrtT [Porphyromonas sp.]
MRRITLSIIIAFCSVVSLVAGPVSPHKAAEIAADLFRRIDLSTPLRDASEKAEIRLDRTVWMDADIQARNLGHEGTAGQACFYVFNRGENEGFALVAADDLLPEVLAYSHEGQMQMDDLPDNLAYMLRQYKEEIRFILSSGVDASDQPVYRFGDLPSSVPPLMESGQWKDSPLRWGQRSPFNSVIGADKYTGCVATAIAQVMRYHAWPEKGQGSYSYTDYYGNDYSVTLGHPYDWNNMPSNGRLAVTEQQRKAVGLLLNDVGKASGMSYASDGSYTYNTPVVRALRNNFFYKKSLRMVDRHSMTAKEWQRLLRTELSQNRPVFYAGQDRTAGHAFVCDGYAVDGTYHFNWGWDGKSNGYYYLTLLAPNQLGVGAGDGTYTFLQEMLIGVEPERNPEGSKLGSLDFRLSDGYRAGFPEYQVNIGDEKISGIIELRAINEYDPQFIVGMRVERPDGSTEYVRISNEVYTSVYLNKVEVAYSFPRSLLQKGTNKLRFVTKRPEESDSEWNPVFAYAGLSRPYFDIIEGDKPEVKLIPRDNSNLSVTKIEASLKSNAASTFDLHCINTGVDEFRKVVELRMVPINSDGARTVKFRGVMFEVAPNSEPTVVHLFYRSLNALPGKYKLIGQVRGGNYENIEFGEVEVWNTWDDQSLETISGEAQRLVYPNPAQDAVRLLNPTPGAPVDYTIYSMDGRLMLQGMMQEVERELDLSALPAATYILRIGSQFTKLVKN